MSTLVLAEIDDTLLARLRERAQRGGRTPESEAKMILAEALQMSRAEVWARTAAIREQLAGSGRSFGDSAELLREDRGR